MKRIAIGLRAAGPEVERESLTKKTPAEPRGDALIAVVSNTYYWTPDLPTLHFLKRTRLNGSAVIGLIGGAGSTARPQKGLMRI